MAQVSI